MERATKLPSRSKRNNLIFYNIPELRQESSATTETLLHQFLEQNLDKAEEIPIEQAHRLSEVRASLLNLAFRKIKSAYYQAPAHLQEQIMAFHRIFWEREWWNTEGSSQSDETSKEGGARYKIGLRLTVDKW